MGIKYLWNILTPFCERKPLYELQGKTVAVDLSCWICEAQNISEYQVQPKMYLRNLYFRASYLLLMEVYPVFVLEGKAPELKYDTIAARNAIQFKGAKPKTDGVKTGKDRTRFHYVLKQCQEMLGYMGLVCLTGQGEAESFCAYLNQKGFVSGCISQDSDCFAYGAQVVYRNFSISSQGSHSASGGAVDVYDINTATASLGFGRNKIIALALLCGSDYSEGVPGVGKDSSLKFFERYSDDEILDRMRNWRANGSVFEEFEKQLADKNICTSCGHTGKIQAHNKSGCKLCKTTIGCDFSKYKDERLLIKNEVNIRNKALEDSNFPNEDLVAEYLTCKDKVSNVNLKWTQPDLVKFVKFTTKYLGWEEVYSFEKFLPILTRWQLINYKDLEILDQAQKLRGTLHPNRIKKKRSPKGVPSYEIIWSDEQNFFKNLIPDSQLLEIRDMEKFWSTIEPQNLVEKAYPKLVEDFLESKNKPKKATRRKAKKINELDNSFKNISLSEPVAKKVRRAKPKKAKESAKDKNEIDELNESLKNVSLDERVSANIKPTQSKKDKQLDSGKSTETNTKGKRKNVKTLDDFFKQAIVNNFNQKNGMEFTSTPKKKVESICKFNIDDTLETSSLEDQNDSDLSDILDGILATKIPNVFREQLEEMGYEICDNTKENQDEPKNCASFFTKTLTENDLFEQTFNDKYLSSDDEMDHVIEPEDNEDSFEIAQVPLLERLKNKKL